MIGRFVGVNRMLVVVSFDEFVEYDVRLSHCVAVKVRGLF